MFVPDTHVQLSLLFMGKARGLSYIGVAEMYLLRVGAGLMCKHFVRLDKISCDKHSSLLQTIINYGRKKFYNIGPWNVARKVV